MAHEKLRPNYFFDETKIEQLKQIAPECFEDGKINFEALKENLGDWTQDEEDPELEHFGLFWPGKRNARKAAALPPEGTLEPVWGDGLKADGTPDTDGSNDSRNIFIEGENLEVLKLMQKSYAGKIKMIYIDPPYNTGNDFVYDDDFTEPLQEYLRRTGQIDEEGKALTTNKRSDGRFHSKWLSMMYPRLRLARNLLREDGVIFVSIDDNEVHNLRAIMNEIFGEENFLAQFVWRTDGNFDNQAKIKNCHEYIITYTKRQDIFPFPPVIDPNIKKDSKLFKPEIRNTLVKNGPKNPPSKIKLPKGFPIDIETGTIEAQDKNWPHYLNKASFSNNLLDEELTAFSGWSSKDLLLEFIEKDCQPIIDSKGQETKFAISKSGAIEIVKIRGDKPSHVISVLNNFGNTQSTSSRLKELGISFDYPKPTQLIEYLISMNDGDNFIVLDFFAGSNSTGESVVNFNSKYNKSVQFISVQLPHPVIVNSHKGQTISDISLSRTKMIGDKLNGVRVFKLKESNYKPWKNYQGTSVDQLQLQLEKHNENPLNENYSKDGLLTEVILLEGFTLCSTISLLNEVKTNSIKKVNSEYCDHQLLVCLDEKIKKETIAALQLGDEDIFICLDSAISTEDKLRLSDKGLIKII